MCTHSRLVYNKYLRRSVLVSCGKCKECQQQKANSRANRIRNHSKEGYISLFVTLTYSPEFVPYVLRSEISEVLESQDVNIYRDASVRLYRGKRVVRVGRILLDTVRLDEPVSLVGCVNPRKSPKDYIGVCYFRDVQNFMKRLRINLERKNIFTDVTSFQCSEYGPCTKRPHFHLLIFIRPDDEKALRLAIVESWLFADKSRTEKYIEVAKNAASYVASYVNSHFDCDSILKKDVFRQKHSMSKDFGVRLQCFTLASVLEKVRRGDLRYNVRQTRDGVPCLFAVPVPKYVINRYFPKFKGYSLFTDSQVHELLLRTQQLCKECSLRDVNFTYTSEESRRLAVRMSNIYSRFKRELGWTYERFCIDYPFLYTRAWNIYNSQVFKDSFDNVNVYGDFSDFYENANELEFGLVHAPTLAGIFKFQTNPNKRKDVVNRSSSLSVLYDKCDKSRKVVNYSMSELGHFV